MTNPIESLDEKVEDYKEKGMRRETRYVVSYHGDGLGKGYDIELLISSKGRYILHCICGGTTFGAVDREKRFVIECLGGPDPLLFCGRTFSFSEIGHVGGIPQIYCFKREVYSIAKE